MFSAVPQNYDRMNRILTLRMDELWRKRAVNICFENKPTRLLDLGTGTGDLAIHMARSARNEVVVTGLDYSAEMLDLAKRKAGKYGVEIRWIHGDASQMPFPDQHFDIVGIAFAFRNLTYRNPLMKDALREVRRVLKPGGSFVIVESSQPGRKWMRALRNVYVDLVVRNLTGRLSGHRNAYRYLAHSVKDYHNPEQVEALLHEAGFPEVDYHPQFFGVAGIWQAR